MHEDVNPYKNVILYVIVTLFSWLPAFLHCLQDRTFLLQILLKFHQSESIYTYGHPFILSTNRGYNLKCAVILHI